MIATSLGEQSKLASRTRAEFIGKAEIKCLQTRHARAIGIATPLEETREAEEIEAIDSVALSLLRRDKGVDFSKESSEAAQIHLVVPDYAHKRFR